MTLEKAIRCMPSYIRHLGEGATNLLTLQTHAVLYCVEKGILVVDKEKKHFTYRRGDPDAARVSRWLEITGGSKEAS